MQIPAALNPVEEIKTKFGDALLHNKEFRGEITLIVDPAKLVDVMLFLRNAPGFAVVIHNVAKLVAQVHLDHFFHVRIQFQKPFFDLSGLSPNAPVNYILFKIGQVHHG